MQLTFKKIERKMDEKEKGRNETGRNQFDIGIDIVR